MLDPSRQRVGRRAIAAMYIDIQMSNVLTSIPGDVLAAGEAGERGVAVAGCVHQPGVRGPRLEVAVARGTAVERAGQDGRNATRVHPTRRTARPLRRRVYPVLVPVSQ